MISPDTFRSLVKPGLERVPKALSGGKSVLHICGAADSIIYDIAACEFDGLSLEEGTKDLKTAARIAHESGVTLIGNISTSETLFRGRPEDVKKRSFHLSGKWY